jgi:hypothetical protein
MSAKVRVVVGAEEYAPHRIKDTAVVKTERAMQV